MIFRSLLRHCLLLVVICLSLLACTHNSNKAIEAEVRPFHMDTTVGSYGVGREERLILVTIDKDTHNYLTQSDSRQRTNSDLPERYADLMDTWALQYGITRVADWPVPPLKVNCLIFESDGIRNLQEIIASLDNLPEVEVAQAVQNFDLAQNSPYNDPYFPLQHAARSMRIEHTHQWASGKGVKIAVIDTGVDTTNPEIAGRSQDSYNFVDSDELQFNSDVHGTAVAGVIAAAANNDTGMVGIAPGARLLPMKACWQIDNDGEKASCNSITLLKALDTAIQEQVHVINLSLAGPRDRLLEQLVQAALDRNIIVVGARFPGNPDLFPAAVQGTISVTDSRDKTVGVVKAQGQNVLSLHPQKDYEFYNGSSFSTAHVAGLAALVRELAPAWSTAEIKSLLKATSDLGTGAANACRAISFIVDADPEICDQS